MDIVRAAGSHFNAEHGSWIVEDTVLQSVIDQIVELGYTVENVMEFPESTRPKIKVHLNYFSFMVS